MNYTFIYINEVFDMTLDECYAKAEVAVAMGIIKPDQIESYSKFLYEKHRNDINKSSSSLDIVSKT